MLKEVLISEFRSCVSVRLQDMGGLVVLLGRNGSGKTNILRAIEWAARAATSAQMLAEYRPSHRKVMLEIALQENVFKYTIEAQAELKSGEKPEIETDLTEIVEVKKPADGKWDSLIVRKNEQVAVVREKENLKIGRTVAGMSAMASILPETHPTNLALRPLRAFLDGVRYYPLDEPFEPREDFDRNGVITSEEYTVWVTNLKSTGDSGDSVSLRILNMNLERPDDFAELVSLVGSNGLGLIDQIEVQTFQLPTHGKKADEKNRVYYFVSFKPSDGPDRRLFNFSDLSTGSRRVLRILVSMLFDRSTVLLMEQLEDAIHSNLMSRLTGLIKSNTDPLQFILATHSSTVFNQILPDEVRLVSMNKGTTSLRPLSHAEQAAAKEFMRHEGPFSDFLDMVQER